MSPSSSSSSSSAFGARGTTVTPGRGGRRCTARKNKSSGRMVVFSFVSFPSPFSFMEVFLEVSDVNGKDVAEE